MSDKLKQTLSSRKFLTAVAVIATALVQAVGVPIPEETMITIVVIGASYIIGQGLADAGKEAVKIDNGITHD